MPRNIQAYIDDILNALRKIDQYKLGLMYQNFLENELIQDAMIRNLEIIGEAVKNIPDNIKLNFSEIEWKKISGLRDILIHAYFGIDLELLWDVIQNKINALKAAMLKIQDILKSGEKNEDTAAE